MASPNQIWVPKTETQVTVVDGHMTIVEHMKMELKPVTRSTGFGGLTEMEKEAVLAAELAKRRRSQDGLRRVGGAD